MSSQRAESPIMSMLKLKLEENGSKNIWNEDEKLVNLKCNKEESGSNDEFIESAPIDIIKNEKKELDQEELDLYIEKSYVKWETNNFKKEQVEFNDSNNVIVFDNDVMETFAIEKDSNDDKIGAENLNYSHECPMKSEIIEKVEVHIKHEENIDDGLQSEIILKPQKQTVLHQCSDCSYSTIHKGNLKTHSIKHKKLDEIDLYSCEKCPFKSSYKCNLKTHAETHNNSILKCSKCPYGTSRPSNLKRHDLKHKPNIRWWNCPECSFKTHLQSYFKKHILAHRSDAFKCSKCSYQSRTKQQLTTHQVKHEGMDQWHSCPLCPYKTHHKIMLKKHCQQRHSIDLKNPKQIIIFKCSECTYESGCKFRVKKHELIHDRSNWFQCSDCAYKSSDKRNLKKHQMRRHQDENAEGWHRCLECHFKTMSNYDLQKHVISHKCADEIRIFKCPQCSFKTAYNNCLIRHKLKHKETHEIEWFCCYKCEFKTKQKSYLITHMWKHKRAHEIDWFSCHQCPFKTKYKSNLVSHVSKHKKQSDEGYLQSNGKLLRNPDS